MHGYAGPHVASPGDAMVDPKDHLGVTHSAYVVLAPAAPSPSVVAPDALLTRMGDLEKSLHQVQDGDHQSYQFGDLCYFPKVVLPPKFLI